jgi:hypothetical protein
MPDSTSPRRRFQFRLMLMILLMTLACVIAATVHYYREGARYIYELHYGVMPGVSPSLNHPAE